MSDSDDDAPKDARKAAGAAKLLSGINALGRVKQRTFRVVELTREPDGRVRRNGSIWQPDLDMARRFARVVAAQSNSDRVVVADVDGHVLEDLPVASPATAHVNWANWRSQPLPPLPPRRPPKPAPKPRAAPAPAPLAPQDVPDLGDAIDLDLGGQP